VRTSPVIRAFRENPAGLPGRRLEVIRAAGAGADHPEIAQQLVLSVRTVDHHVFAVLDKLGVRGRRQAATRATELGCCRPGGEREASEPPSWVADTEVGWS
jgi:DNA-binding NarL/FixJ family response regulator